MNESLIQRVPLFASLPPGEIEHLARTLRPVSFASGDRLFDEGEHGDRFYIVQSGQIEILKSAATPEERLVGVRGPGEYVGEMSLFNRDGRRTATARAQTEVEALEMTRADFDALLHRQPELAYEMVRVLSLRLTQAHNTATRDLEAKNQQLTEAYESLKAAQAQLVEKEKLEHELRVAHQVQAGLLPHRTPQLPGWEFAAYWQPARTVSGDFYDFVLPANGESPWGLVIADVSDKGMGAALFMALSRSIVRASAYGAGSLAERMAQANRLICADSAQGMFVTLCYAELEPASGQSAYVNAGHNPPWLYRRDVDAWAEFERTGMVMGMFADSPFVQRTVTLAPGDVLVMYTDGLLDASNATQERLGKEGVREVLHAYRHASAREIVAALDQALTRFRGEAPVYDDITLLVIRRDAGKHPDAPGL